MSTVGFLRSEEMTGSLRIGDKGQIDDVGDGIGVRTEAYTFRSQVGIGSESDCLLG